MLASELSKVPFSFTLHGPTEFFSPKAWRLDMKVAKAQFVICISHFSRSQAMIFSDPTHWNKFKIVHCGVKPELYRSTSHFTNPELNLLFVGRLIPLKGLRILFEAIAIARKRRPEINLTIIGDGSDRNWLEKEAAKLGGIELLGYLSQSDVAETLSNSDALILPSFAEGLPVVLMEALASECPVIASRVAGVEELVIDGITGLIVAPGDAQGLSEAIVSLASNPEHGIAMARAGRIRVERDFNIDLEAAWLLKVLKGQSGEALRPETTINGLDTR